MEHNYNSSFNVLVSQFYHLCYFQVSFNCLLFLLVGHLSAWHAHLATLVISVDRRIAVGVAFDRGWAFCAPLILLQLRSGMRQSGLKVTWGRWDLLWKCLSREDEGILWTPPASLPCSYWAILRCLPGTLTGSWVGTGAAGIEPTPFCR